MTIQEVSDHYKIPLEILHEYERWELCGASKKKTGAWQYDDSDLERLSMIMTLHDIGFEFTEIEIYMKFLLHEKETENQRINMLNKKRDSTLRIIHFYEKQLTRLDYLRYRIQTQQK